MIRLRGLGECVIEVGGHTVTPDSGVLFALLLFLSSSAGRAIARNDVLELLWPDSAEDSARHRLRQALYQLKKLGAPVTTPDSVISLRAADVEVDYAVYAIDRHAVVRSVREAVSFEYLPHYTPTFSPRFARWVEAERDRVRCALRRYLLDAMTEGRARGRHEEVVALARACLDLDPLNG